MELVIILLIWFSKIQIANFAKLLITIVLIISFINCLIDYVKTKKINKRINKILEEDK